MMRRCLAGLVLLALALTFGNVRAAPLDAATCGMLKGEQVQLEQTGVRGNMAKGPDWAKVNLAPEKLDQIRRLLQLDEQLLFRCSSRTLVELPPDADADPAAKAPEKKEGEDADQDGASALKDGAAKDDASAAAKQKAGKKTAPSKKAAASPGDDVAAGAKVTPDTPKTGTPKAAGTAGPAPKKQALPKDQAKAPAPKAKPKQDDAYKPPPPNPAVDPFANQPRQ